MELPSPIFSLPMKVRDYELDAEGIVNNARYLNYFEYTRHEFCEQAGISFGEMMAQGLVPVVKRAVIDYRLSLGSGARFTSCLALSRRGPRFEFHQWIVNEQGEVVADGQITVVNVKDGRPTRGDELAGWFSKYL